MCRFRLGDQILTLTIFAAVVFDLLADPSHTARLAAGFTLLAILPVSGMLNSWSRKQDQLRRKARKAQQAEE